MRNVRDMSVLVTGGGSPKLDALLVAVGLERSEHSRIIRDEVLLVVHAQMLGLAQALPRVLEALKALADALDGIRDLVAVLGDWMVQQCFHLPTPRQW